VFYGIGYALFLPKVIKAAQEQQQQMQQQATEEYGDVELPDFNSQQ